MVEGPFKYKVGSRDRGKCWDKVANLLNAIEKPHFTVYQRAVRDRFVKLEKGFKRKVAEENRASGVVPEHTE